MLKCPLCGYTFDMKESATACRGCPLSRGCNMVRCPNCNYEFPLPREVPKIFKKLRWRS